MRASLAVSVIWLAACGGMAPRPAAPPSAAYTAASRSSSESTSRYVAASGASNASISDEELASMAEAESASGGEVITVTGSAIDRRELTAAAPTAVVDAAPAPPPPNPAEIAAQNGVSAVAGVAQQQAAAPAAREELVIEGWIGVEVDSVEKAAAEVRKRVVAVGGRIVSDTITTGGTGVSGEMVIRVPPEHATGMVDWVNTLGDVRSRRVEGTDVSRTLIDQELALENHQITMKRLQELVQRPNLEMKDVLALEQELTRIRGEIEKIKGEYRWLKDRVALATLHLTLVPKPGVVLGEPTTKLYPGPRFAALMLLRPGDRQRTRLGGGVALHLGVPRVSIELDVFAGPDGESPTTTLTFGGALYSDHFGRGKRAFLNPYLGLRGGYGYLEGSRFVAAGDVGVELFKHRYVLIDANLRTTALVGDETDIALVGALSAVIAF